MRRSGIVGSETALASEEFEFLLETLSGVICVDMEAWSVFQKKNIVSVHLIGLPEVMLFASF